MKALLFLNGLSPFDQDVGPVICFFIVTVGSWVFSFDLGDFFNSLLGYSLIFVFIYGKFHFHSVIQI